MTAQANGNQEVNGVCLPCHHPLSLLPHFYFRLPYKVVESIGKTGLPTVLTDGWDVSFEWEECAFLVGAYLKSLS